MSQTQIEPYLHAMYPAMHSTDPCSLLSTLRTSLDQLSFTWQARVFAPFSLRSRMPHISGGLRRLIHAVAHLAPDILAHTEGLFCEHPRPQYLDYSTPQFFTPDELSKSSMALLTTTAWSSRFFKGSSKIHPLHVLLMRPIRYYLFNTQSEQIRITNLFHDAVANTTIKDPRIKKLIENPHLLVSTRAHHLSPLEVASMAQMEEKIDEFFDSTSVLGMAAAAFTYFTLNSTEINERLALQFLNRADVLEYFKHMAAVGKIYNPNLPDGLDVNLLQLAIEKGYYNFFQMLLGFYEGIDDKLNVGYIQAMRELPLRLDRYTLSNFNQTRLPQLRAIAKIDEVTPLASALLSHQENMQQMLIDVGTDLSCSKKPHPYPYLQLAILDCNSGGLERLLASDSICTHLTRSAPPFFHASHAMCSKKEDFIQLLDLMRVDSRFSLSDRDHAKNTLYHQIAFLISQSLQRNEEIPEHVTWFFEYLNEHLPSLADTQNKKKQFPDQVIETSKLEKANSLLAQHWIEQLQKLREQKTSTQNQKKVGLFDQIIMNHPKAKEGDAELILAEQDSQELIFRPSMNLKPS